MYGILIMYGIFVMYGILVMYGFLYIEKMLDVVDSPAPKPPAVGPPPVGVEARYSLARSSWFPRFQRRDPGAAGLMGGELRQPPAHHDKTRMNRAQSRSRVERASGPVVALQYLLYSATRI